MIPIAKTVTPLAAGGVWDIGEWAGSGGLNKNTQGEVMAIVSAYSDQPGTLVIYQSDDPANPQMVLPSGDSISIVGGKVGTIQVAITHAFWLAGEKIYTTDTCIAIFQRPIIFGISVYESFESDRVATTEWFPCPTPKQNNVSASMPLPFVDTNQDILLCEIHGVQTGEMVVIAISQMNISCLQRWLAISGAYSRLNDDEHFFPESDRLNKPRK